MLAFILGHMNSVHILARYNTLSFNLILGVPLFPLFMFATIYYLTHILRIREIPGSNFSSEIGYPD